MLQYSILNGMCELGEFIRIFNIMVACSFKLLRAVHAVCAMFIEHCHTLHMLNWTKIHLCSFEIKHVGLPNRPRGIEMNDNIRAKYSNVARSQLLNVAGVKLN